MALNHFVFHDHIPSMMLNLKKMWVIVKKSHMVFAVIHAFTQVYSNDLFSDKSWLYEFMQYKKICNLSQCIYIQKYLMTRVYEMLHE